jgi:hypothetical protein
MPNAGGFHLSGWSKEIKQNSALVGIRKQDQQVVARTCQPAALPIPSEMMQTSYLFIFFISAGGPLHAPAAGTKLPYERWCQWETFIN